MTPKAEIGTATLQKALDAATVRAALDDRARRFLAAAQREAHAAGRHNLARRMELDPGVRPGVKARRGLKRPYTRIIAHLTEGELIDDARTAKATPSQILRRAARG